MKRYVLMMVGLLLTAPSLACPVCDNNQPRPLRGITHGTGPESQWDYIIIIFMSIIVILTLFYSVKWLIRPGENSANHIKRSILLTSTHGR